MLLVAGGVGPLLAVHTKGPAPEDVRVTVCPTQIVDKDGVMLIGDAGDTETVATAVAVHVPEPDNTV